MSARELLELAAKAAGAKWTDYSDRTPDRWVIQHTDGTWRPWAPLTDDGDALRLAVKLRIVINPRDFCVTVQAPLKPMLTEYGTDLDAATRRAIVRAAAEIGKAMP